MAVDLRMLGKLLALSRSDEPAEAALALSRFTTALNRWCSDNNLPVNVGYVTLAEPSNAACKLAEALAGHCEVRVLALEPFELIAVGPEIDCRWIYWWFAHTYPEIEKTARRANFRERHLFMHGAIMGIEQAITRRAHSPKKSEDRRGVEKPQPITALDEQGEPVKAAPPEPPPPLSQPQRSTMNDGMAFGMGLAAKLMQRMPPP